MQLVFCTGTNLSSTLQILHLNVATFIRLTYYHHQMYIHKGNPGWNYFRFLVGRPSWWMNTKKISWITPQKMDRISCMIFQVIEWYFQSTISKGDILKYAETGLKLAKKPIYVLVSVSCRFTCVCLFPRQTYCLFILWFLRFLTPHEVGHSTEERKVWSPPKYQQVSHNVFKNIVTILS